MKRPPRTRSSRCGRRPSTTRSSPSSAARRSGPSSRSRTRSRARCAARSTPSRFETEAVTIVGEHDFAVRAHLIARAEIELERIEAVLSHPQPLAQCARFLRESLPGVERRSVSQHRRRGADGERVGAALGGDRGPVRGRALRLRRSSARGSRTRPTTSPASSGSPPPGPRSSAAGRARPRWSSPSSARTIPGPWSTRCGSSRAGRST